MTDERVGDAMVRQVRPKPRNEHAADTRPKGRVRRFLHNTRGVAALEFAMVAPAFFALLFPMFEVGITYAADAVLQNAVNEASRKIRTGAVQSDGLTAAQFRTMVCDELTVPLSCDDALLKIDVRVGTSFGDPLTAGGEFRDDYQFRPGVPGDTVVVRALYAWTPVTPCLGNFMTALDKDREAGACEGKTILQATAAFRNEPYQGAIDS